ncbi:MAG: lipoprotein [Xanthobacteraceae bacterium]|nr:lipoprotein [Xanthobacteraceae bacterium]GIK97729.1 MAG: hypothetical protein BroJett029_19380 [Alphaproteobacteria bacterium]
MRKILLVAVTAVAVTGCTQTARQDRVLGGAVVGGATGAAIGGIASRSVGGAVAGGVIGAAAGGILGAATAPAEPCYVRTRSGRLRRVACY